MNVLLIAISVIWLFAASVTDIKKREVADWLSFSMFSIGLFFALLSAITLNDYSLLLTTAITVAIFLIIANALYYMRLFGGGDAKLLIALSTIIPQLTFPSILGLPSAATFLLNCTFIGAIYGMIYAMTLAVRHGKHFKEKISEIKLPFWPFLIVSLILAAASFFTYQFILIIAVLVILFPVLYIFTKAVEDVALIKNIDASKLTEGDWLVHPIKIGRKVISARLGLTKKDIELLKKYRTNVKIKEGIPFVPVFLVAFILSLGIGNLFELLMAFFA